LTNRPLFNKEMKELKEVNSMIEEFMLLANIYVARKIFSTFPQCAMLRYACFFLFLFPYFFGL